MKMKININILVVLILLSGCSQTKLINHKLSLEYIEKINEKVSNQSAQIDLQNGKIHNAKDIFVTPDFIEYFDEPSKQKHHISSLELKDIVTTKENVSLKPWIDLSIKPRIEIKEKTKKRAGKAILIDGSIVEGYNILVTLDSTIFYDSARTHKTVLSTSQIKQIIIKDKGKGGLYGLLFGALVAAIAVPISQAIEEDVKDKRYDIGPMETGAYVAPITVPLGAVLGVSIGYNSGNKIKFIFTESDHINKEK
jgi:hypothetical protein